MRRLAFLQEAIQPALAPLDAALEARQPVPALGLRRAARLPVLASLQALTQRPILFIIDRNDRALSLFEESELWLPEGGRIFFPEPTPLFYEQSVWGERTRQERLQALTNLAKYHLDEGSLPSPPPVIFAAARSVMTRTMPRASFLAATRGLRKGQRHSLPALLRHFVSIGYTLENLVVSAGQFAHRGGILDIWPPSEPHPVRLEFFGDEIESLRVFDPASQRRLDVAINELLVTPAREYLVPAHLTEDEHFQFNEFHIPQLHPQPASLLDYLPQTCLVVIDDAQSFADAVYEIEEQAVKLRQELTTEGLLGEDFPVPYITWSELQEQLSLFNPLVLGHAAAEEVELGAPFDQPQEAHFWANAFESGPRFGGRLKPLMEYVQEVLQKGEQVVILSRQCARLKELWEEVASPHPKTAPLFLEGSLNEGFHLQREGHPPILLLTDGEIFGWRRAEPRRRPMATAEAPETAYADLQPGDYVVHVDHGIGRYLGLVQRTLDGVEREYLCLEYANDTQLFVPVHQANRLTRYIGPSRQPPALNHLGTQEWRSTKARVKEAVKEVAQELLELYAQRSIVQGYAFSEDTPWQGELEASFPYIETRDQVQVLQEVKRDMQSQRPMDRLICGDVGYGKTEVALRAAFKAVMDNKQVAMLVPTTVLAQQHFKTFQQRLAAFPVSVEMLSRFRSPQEQREIIDALALGKLDIVIGTHRLLSPDVRFKDLGLVIIDEEQRFGVTHKERLKKLRTEVDVLTLTATPIPRTLYMALSGIRDISTINTPPEERLPIITHVGPYTPRLVRQAILRELERGGQVFFVHNRVQTIEAMRAHLASLVPEARLAIAHGQMPEEQLASVMEAFSEGQIDVLLCTSIIESGLDIPNANTLIVDRADTFGLAQLYQLRGRVGRGAQRAYAYFFRHRKKLPSPDGRRRLDTIAENTQLGAGFSIAMRDLEIRGAGDVLGTRQHGHIAAVGFHLYTTLLAEAVRNLRQERAHPDKALPFSYPLQITPVHVDLPLAVRIPKDYVADKDVRLGLYRRLAEVRTLEELDAMVDEFNDRFGEPPQETLNLFFQLKVKNLAEQVGLSSISVDSGQIALRFSEDKMPPQDELSLPHVRIGKTALWLPYTGNPVWKEQLLDVLLALKESHEEPGSRQSRLEEVPG